MKKLSLLLTGALFSVSSVWAAPAVAHSEHEKPVVKTEKSMAEYEKPMVENKKSKTEHTKKHKASHTKKHAKSK
ncbi:MAG: hypothetical protein K2P98_06365 [Neisseriaceae bacterium]|nr:hypothetical protein [Neisseriaceae bacterium]